MKDKVVLITGANQGLGKELSLQLARLGAKIALVARTEKLLQEVQSQIKSSGGVAQYFVCDVTDFNQVNSTVANVIDKFGTIDVLINNAGVWTTDRLEEKDNELVRKSFLVNSIGPIYFSKAVTPIFEKNKSGHFVFINSIGGLDVNENKQWPVYSATKWAITGYAKNLTYRYDNTGIKVTSIHPGAIDTNMPINSGDDWGEDHSFMMQPSEVANAVIYAINAPGKIQVGIIELKKTNWNS